MAGHAGNFFTTAIGRQTAKGTAQTTPKFKLRLTGSGVIVPEPQVLDLPETDSSIQRSRAIRIGFGIGGGFEPFVRSDEASFLWYLHMGAVATTGVGPYTHTITAATQLPYLTAYNAWDSTALVERVHDCKLTELSTQGGAVQALTSTVAVAGLAWTGGETDPASPVPSTVEPLVYPHVTVTFGGVTTDIVEQFTIRSFRAAQIIHGDTGMTPSDIVTGRWGVEGTLRVLFETDAIWRDWLTDSPTGTAITQAMPTAALNITASRTAASDEVSWDIDNAELRQVRLGIDPAGNPLFYDIEWSAKPDPTIANTLSVVAKNNTASLTS